MKSKIKQYNIRQINLMEQKINDYLNNKISAINLSKDLYILIREIQELPEDFFYNFVKPLSWIEGSFVRSCDENRDYFTDEELSLIKEAVEKIKGLIVTYKKKYLSNS